MKLNKKSVLLAGLVGITSQSILAADLSIVIDDSAGMCGYLSAPVEQNTYKKALTRLLQAKDASHLNINAYYLSDLNKSMQVGTAIDRILQANATNCPFTALHSPLHQAVDLQKIKSRSVVLVTDLLFDEGAQGGSNSRSAFIEAFDHIAKTHDKNISKWFATNAGIMGLKAPFLGNYYAVNGVEKQKISQSIERPFYVVWLSNDARFRTFLNQMTYLWRTPNWNTKKYAHEGALAVRLLPTTEYINVKEGLYSPTIKPSLIDPTQVKAAQLYYLTNHPNTKKLDQFMPINRSGEYPIPAECFKTNTNPLHIQFAASCAKDGGNEAALLKADKFPQALMINYPLSNNFVAINRSFNVVTEANGFNNPAQAFYRTTSQSALFGLNKYKSRKANLVVYVKGLKAATSLLSNSPKIQSKTLKLDISEKFSANPNVMKNLNQVTHGLWSSEQEPCVQKNAVCKLSVSTTYQLESLLQSMATRLNAGEKTAILLNATYAKPTTLTIEYK